MASVNFKQRLVEDITANIVNENSTSEVTTDQIVNLIQDTKGAFFTVKFIKKDGTERVMNARFGVKKHLKGGSLPYDRVQKGLLSLWDPKAAEETGNGYRLLSVGAILSAKINGVEYIVKNPGGNAPAKEEPII